VIVRTPTVALSADGRRLAIGAATQITVIDTRSGERQTFDTTVGADLLSVPTGDSADLAAGVAVAAHDGLEIVGGAQQRLVGMAAVLLRSRDVLIVITRSDSAGTHLGAYSVDGLVALFEPVALGPVSVHTAEVATTSMCLLGGQRGPRAWDGPGDPYLRGVRISSDGVEVVWDGANADTTAPILGARNGTVVMGSGSGFVVGTIDDLVMGATMAGPTYDAGGSIGQFALSPSSRTFCMTVGTDTTVRVVSGSVGEAELVDHGPLTSLTSSTCLAVDDEGNVVVAEVLSAREMTLSQASPHAELQLLERYEFPRSVVRSFSDEPAEPEG
jgi:hypothetical protein